MIFDFVIIGGGTAGLSAAIRLGELGKSALIIESGTYPSHKICGEFFSPQSIEQLNHWGIKTIEIAQANFYVPGNKWSFTFPKKAGSLSHITFDPLLVSKAHKAEIFSNTKVTSIVPGFSSHEITLSSGATIKTEKLLIATGKVLQKKQKKMPAFPYFGIKSHFKLSKDIGSLEMFLFPGGYVGVSPIENGQCNIAGLISARLFLKYGSANRIIETFKKKNSRFLEILANSNQIFSDWMVAPIPSFGFKQLPVWPNTYFLGDAAATVPPITGNGLSIAIRNGVLAAEYAIEKDATGFKYATQEGYSKSIIYGKWMHYLAVNSFSSGCIAWIGKRFPRFIEILYSKSR
ncbi:MAG: NAD(P)/FAD-dependent oxidoreductase [Chlamydiales bacterium]